MVCMNLCLWMPIAASRPVRRGAAPGGGERAMSGVDERPSDGAAPLVSVIVPSYNSEAHILEALESALSQTMADLEVLSVDDASQDRTRSLVEELAQRDRRLRTFAQASNRGVALARNRGLAHARGRYIAYLDSDDQWMPNKLERQIAFMTEAGAGACFTSYETIEENGDHRNFVKVPATIDYKGFLKNTVSCSHTILFDTRIVDRGLLQMPDLRRGQDAATWLGVMKAGHVLYGLDECLAKYRKTAGSLSSSKTKAIRRTWHLYRDVEGLSRPYSAYCLFWQLLHAVQKRRRDA